MQYACIIICACINCIICWTGLHNSPEVKLKNLILSNICQNYFWVLKKTTCTQIRFICNANLCLQFVFKYLQNIDNWKANLCLQNRFWYLKSKLYKSDIRSASSKWEGTPSLVGVFSFCMAVSLWFPLWQTSGVQAAS